MTFLKALLFFVCCLQLGTIHNSDNVPLTESQRKIQCAIALRDLGFTLTDAPQKEFVKKVATAEELNPSNQEIQTYLQHQFQLPSHPKLPNKTDEESLLLYALKLKKILLSS